MGQLHSSGDVRRLLIVDDGTGCWGAQRCILRLAPFLESANFSLGLLSPAASEFSSEWSRQGLKNIFSFPAQDADLSARDQAGNLSLWRALRAAMILTRRTLRIIRVASQFRADVILANSFWTHYDVAVAGLLGRRPTVLYLHEECPSGLPAKALRVAVRLSRASIAVSRDVAASVDMAERVRVVSNGIDAEKFSPDSPDPSVRRELCQEPNSPLVVSLSRLDEAKQIDHIIRAVAALDGELATTQLCVIGDTTSTSTYGASLVALGDELLGQRVKFLPQRSDVVDILRCADLYVLAGRHEGMPLGILEAQATGCPVVAYPAAGVRDLISDGVTGLVADMNDWRSLAGKISQVLSDSELRTRMSVSARDDVVERFTLLQQSEAIAQLLAGVTE